jgi:PAS domain S-box-containing protein
VHFRYDEARLLDAQGVTRLSVPAGLPTVPTSVAKGISNALQSGQVLIQDFYRSERDQQVHLGILVPILDESDANRPLGVFFLRIDPTVYLYPFIKRWPTPSPTAETLLLRRDGNDVLYLNDLRHQTNTALALRLPLTRTEVPAVRAALGQTGIMIGVDYRGVPVLSFGRAVPDSPWLMIAKIDLTEVNTPMRERLLQIVVLIGILLFGSGAGVGLVWRQQRVKFFRDMAASAEVLRLAEREYHELFESASDALLLIASDTGQVIDANNKAGELYGYERDELLTRKSADLSENPEETSRRIHEAQSKPGQVFSLPMRLHRKKDGTVFPAEIITRSLIREGQPVLFVTCRDITERKQAEADWAQSRAAELNILEDVIAARDQVKQANTSLLSEIAERKQAEEALRQQTEELRANNDELERFNRNVVGRELRMIELKEEINELCRRLGEPPRHATDQLQTDSVPGAGPAPAPPGRGGA